MIENILIQDGLCCRQFNVVLSILRSLNTEIGWGLVSLVLLRIEMDLGTF